MIQKLPKDWKIKNLNDVIVDIIDYRGKTPKKLGGSWSESGIIALSAMNVKQGQLVKLEKAKFVNNELYHKWMKSEVTKDDILMTSEAPLGETYLVPDNRKICLSQRLFCIRANPNLVLPRFLFYFFNTPISRRQIDLKATGTTVLGIRQPDLRELPIIVPPLPTQRKIAAILSAYDDLIENNTRRIKILEDMAQTLYQEWFVHFRFPGHENVSMVESLLGPIPQGWEVKRLADLIETQYGYTESASEDEVGPKFVRGKDINKTSYIDWSTVPFCPIESTEHAKYKLNVNDILVIRMADPGKVAIVEKEIDAVFASYLIRLKFKSKLLSPYYLFYALLDERYQGYIHGVSTGTTRKSASAGVITGYHLVIPSEEVRKRFEGVINSLRRSLNSLLEKNVNLRQTRDLLLPKLISGEIDVSELDIDTNGMQPVKSGTHIPYPLTERLHTDEKILGGKPVIKGTRLAVAFILDLLKQGWSEEEIVENYPSVAHEDIEACRAYEKKVTRASVSR